VTTALARADLADDFNACAEILRKGDPDRFLATMAAPLRARPALFAIFAFNVEVARAPWVSVEPTINEMRLQWWQDVLAQIAAGTPVRRHEVATPLAAVLDRDGAGVLGRLVTARKWDIYAEPFADTGELGRYIQDTSGGLMWVAARALGAQGGEDAVRDIGYAAGLANWFLAVPDLIARGRAPLPDESDSAIGALAGEGLERLRRGRGRGWGKIERCARPATRTGWRAGRTLHSAAANPAAVKGGWLHISEFKRKSSLLLRVLSGSA
jgi:15-cis-phytoene synthase